MHLRMLQVVLPGAELTVLKLSLDVAESDAVSEYYVRKIA